MVRVVLLIGIGSFFWSCSLYSEEAGKAAEAFCECSEDRDFSSIDIDAENQWRKCLMDRSEYTDFVGEDGVLKDEEKIDYFDRAVEEKCPEIYQVIHERRVN